jgi:hypothetical protein
MTTHQSIINREEQVDARSMLLASPHRSPEIPESADAYGWLVGSWQLDIRVYWATDVSTKGLKGEAHFGWALEGRAIQDVWIMPHLEARTSKLDKTMNMYGTTLRVWDPAIQGWRITGSIRQEITGRNRSAGGAVRMWCRSGFVPMGRPRVGCTQRLRPLPFIGPTKH